MKYTLVVILLIMALVSACSNPKKSEPQTDSVQSVKVAHEEIATGGIRVKSEAPDAVAKIVQGYALPKFDDGQAQSPPSIL